MEVSLAPALDPELQLLVGVLDLDHRAVDQHADRDRDPRNRHDVRAHAHEIHGDEGEQDRDRDREDRHDCRRDVPEKQQDHETHDHECSDQFVLQRGNRILDQLRAVVGRDDFDARRQGLPDVFDLLLDALDHLEGVLAVTHHHDAADRVPLSVEVGQPATDLRAYYDASEILDQDRDAILVRTDDDAFDVSDRACIAASAHHVLGPAHLDQAPADVVVALPDGVDHLLDRHAVGEHRGRFEVDLVLLLEAADRRHLGHARHALQPVSQAPVLEAAQLPQVVLSAPVDQGVLVHPTHAGRVRSEFGAHPVGQARQDLAQVLERATASPVDVRAVLKDDVDVGESEVGEATNRLDLRGAEHGRHDWVGDLIFDHVRAAVPARVDDHLRVGQIGDRVERHVAHAVDPDSDRDARDEQDQELIPRAEIDDALDHVAILVALDEKRDLTCRVLRVGPTISVCPGGARLSADSRNQRGSSR